MANPNMRNIKSKYNLLLCELHNPFIHGKTQDSAPNIETHYLVYNKYEPDIGVSLIEYDFEDMEYEESTAISIALDAEFLNTRYSIFMSNFLELRINHPEITQPVIKHPVIRNYDNIIKNKNYIKPEIGECILLPSQEMVVILKTFWIRIIQKAWKKVYKERKSIILSRKSFKNVYLKEIKGYNCSPFPGLQGLLSK
jgi:hypothetical protein